MDLPPTSGSSNAGGTCASEPMHELPDDNNRPAASHSSIEQQRLQSGRNRLGTPRHEQRAARNCDTQNQISISQQQQENAQDSQASGTTSSSTVLTTTETGSNQAPPSYGTATRSCATLDAGQLHQIQMELRQRQLILARAQQQQQMASSSWQDRVGLEATIGHINQAAGQQQQQQYRLSNFESCTATTGGSEFGVRQHVSCAHSLGNLAAVLRQQQQTVAAAADQELRPIDDSYGFLSRQRQQQRPRLCALDKDQLRFAAALARDSQVSQPAARVKKQEEGIYATLNVRPVAGVARLPINHVISGRASMQLERQQQRQAHTLQWPAPPAAHYNCAHKNHKPQPQSHEQTNQLASAQLATPGQPARASFDCSGPATAPATTTDRLIDISSSSSSCASSSCGQPATINANIGGQTLRHCAPPTAAAPNSLAVTSEPRNSSSPTCQNNDFAGRQRLVMASSKDDAPHDGAKCDENRKRRTRQRSSDEIPAGADLAAPPADSGQGEPTTTINYGEHKSAATHASEQTTSQHHNNNANNQTAGAGVFTRQQIGPATISAHCWLIDSGDDDDQDELRNGGAAPKSRNASNYDAAHSAHLKQPLRARSIERLARDKTERKKLTASSKLCQTLRPHSARRVHQQAATCVASSLSSPNVTYDRSDDDDDDADEQDEATTDCEQRQQKRRPTQRRHRRRTRASRTTSRRSAAVTGRHSSPYENASTVVRLSAVLNFVSNLVSGRSRSRQRSSSGKSDVVAQERHAAAATASGAYTGSYTNRTLPCQSYTTTGASSMAYSSSTSAYVTGNSSMHSHDCHSSSLLHVPAPSLVSQSSSPQRNRTPLSSSPSAFVALRRGGGLTGSQQVTDSGNVQQLYRVSIPSTAGTRISSSHHSYEYCDDIAPPTSQTARVKKVYDCGTMQIKPASNHIPIEHLELTTMSNRAQPWTPGHQPSAAKEGSCDSNAASCLSGTSSGSGNSLNSRCSPAQMVGLDQTGLANSGRPLAQTIMSDNELIASSPPGCNYHHLPPASRRRWWWNSFRLWITRRSCRQLPVFSTATTTEDDDGSLTHQRPAGSPNGLSCEHASQAATSGGAGTRQPSAAAARYRCLEPAQRVPTGRGRKPSTLQNVISLAKVDRVFRCRLLASLVISIMLLALICLLALMIYKRSSLHKFNHLSNGRLSLSMRSKYDDQQPALLMDSADFDLSWLWPAQQQQQLVSQFEVPEQKPPPPLNLNGRDLDGQLRSLLHVIDRSERIQQFQLTITHLTNLQLANDHFIDLTQLARILPNSSSGAAAAENRTATSYNESSYETTTAANNTAIGQLELDLASLTLLSNLYWPLVKWRHQSQRSLAANFLSFALASTTGSESPRERGEGDAGASAIRNLLASLILVESFSPDNPGLEQHASSGSTQTHLNLQHFQRLDQQLRLASYHLLTCSLAGGDLERADQLAPPPSRVRFCQLLTRRYKRMMLALGELEHGELAELHRREQASVELPASVYVPPSQDRAPLAQRNKNILNFLLDRMALLDVRLLAELTLATSTTDDDETGGPELANNNNDPAQLEIESLVTNQQQIEANSGATLLMHHFQPPKAGADLYDLVKSTVGDSPMNLMLGNGGEMTSEDSTSQQEQQLDSYLRHFDQLRAEQPDRWYNELLIADLINPWPAHGRLPSLVGAINYDLFLHPNLRSRLVLGMNKIEFELTRPTRFLILNCAQLNVIELSLWMKQPPPVSSNSPPPIPTETGRDTGSQTETTNQKQDNRKRQIAVRRVLNLAESEMLFIELQETIEPHTSLLATKQMVEVNQHAGSPFASSSMANGVEFGELPAQSDQFHATPTTSASGAPYRSQRSAFVRNQFVLNISFNKTSLVEPQTEDITRAGVEFVRYAAAGDDYTVSQPLPSSQSNQADPAAAEEATASKSLMLTKFSVRDNSAGARHLFPCWDEPAFGAKFQLNLVHEYNAQVLFTGQKRERLPYNSLGSLQMTVFEQTPVLLSPSLLALVVSDDLQSAKSLTSRFDQHKSTSGSAQEQHIQVQIWAQFEHLGQAEFASQQLVPQLLAFYQTHLEFAYPLDKIDLVAMPNYHNAPQQERDSSEGLGLLRFRQPERLLVDVNLASQDHLEQVAAGIANRLAHQFFGNIISAPGSGGGVRARWLLEALSEYLGGVALAQIQSEWHLDEQLQLSSSVHETLASEQLTDLIASSPAVRWARQFDPVHADGATVAESLELDLDGAASGQGGETTSSNKHSALVHMMLATLLPTQEARARLLRQCLSAHRYGTMSVHQFWRHFTELLKVEPAAAHDGRLNLIMKSQRVSRDKNDDATYDDQQHETTSDHDLVHVYTEAPSPPSDQANSSSSSPLINERVVFVSHRRRNRKQSPDDHRRQPQVALRVESNKPAHSWLSQAADQWLERASFPLITASCYRDHLQLRQDAFRPLIGKWLASSGAVATTNGSETATTVARNRRETNDDEEQQQPPVWPIPLLFVSRLNPRASRFVWLAQRELEVSLLATDSSGSANSSSPVTSEYAGTTSASSSRLPQQYSWFKLNHNGSSLVRVNYDERNWEALTSLLARAHYSNHQLNPLDRANLLDDAMTLMRHGQLSVSLAMNLTLYLELGERDYQPWSTVLRHFDRLQTHLNQNPLWHQYVLKLLQPISIVVGWKDDGPHLMRKLRRELYALAIAYGDEKLLSKARQEFRVWMLRQSSQFLVPNLQELVYVAGVKYGDQAEWFHCWQKYQQLVGGASLPSKSASGIGRSDHLRNMNATTSQAQLLQQVAAAARNKHMLANGGGGKRSKDQDSATTRRDEDLTGGGAPGLLENEKRQLLTALASTQNTWLIEQFLNYSLDSTKIQAHHLGHVLATLGKNPVARLYLWRFVRLNWFHLEDRFLLTEPGVLESMILESTRHFATELDYEEVSSFFESKWSIAGGGATTGKSQRTAPQVKRALEASLAAIRANIRWRDSIEPKLTRWLSHYNSNSNNNINIAAA